MCRVATKHPVEYGPNGRIRRKPASARHSLPLKGGDRSPRSRQRRDDGRRDPAGSDACNHGGVEPQPVGRKTALPEKSGQQQSTDRCGNQPREHGQHDDHESSLERISDTMRARAPFVHDANEPFCPDKKDPPLTFTR